MFYYTAYGLTIQSDLRLPELVEVPAAQADVVFRTGLVSRRPPDGLQTGRCYHASAGECCLYWADAGLYQVKDGNEIVIEALESAHVQVIRLYLIGGMMALILQQRGLLVLHSSAVSIDGHGVCFVGDCGMGKSTTAATLHARGNPMVTDDIAAIDVRADGPILYPAFPQLKLCPDAAVSLGHTINNMPLAHPDEEKRAHRVAETFATRPVPLRRIHVLHDAPERAIVELPPRVAFMELLRNSYTARILSSVGAAPLHMDQCSRLAKSGHVTRLDRPRDLTRLSEMAQLIESDAIAAPVGA